MHQSSPRSGGGGTGGLFDISKPVWDLYAFRSVRGDALAKYNSLNQSEPLRINLSALGVFVFLSLPTLLTSTDDINNSAALSTLTVPQTLGISIVGALASATFFVKECRKRSRQLTRLEKELVARDLFIKPPASLLADRPFGNAVSIRGLQEYGGGPRILALYTDTVDQMKAVLNDDLRVLGKRLIQANVLVVPIVKEIIIGSNSSSSSKVSQQLPFERAEWLASAETPQEWLAYFDSLSMLTSNANDDADPTLSSSFKWFGLSSTGRSFGSGAGEPPSWLQLMGQHLRPLDIMDPPEDDVTTNGNNGDARTRILKLQQSFYDALTKGHLDQLQGVFVSPDRTQQQVTDVMNMGGRLDSWKFCLEDGARPEGMKIGNPDVTFVSDTRAFSTAVEFPVADGLTDARLLAVQEWEKQSSEDSKDSEWKMVQHQTIPWTTDVAAGGTLICDCRGCVSLVRGNQRRTFGGLIG